MNDNSGFSRIAIAALAALFVIVAAASVLLQSRGGGEAETRQVAYTSTYSRSALGHAALLDLLGYLRIPVLRHLGNTDLRPAANDVLLLAEPDPYEDETRAAAHHFRRIADTLLVLPKRTGTGDPEKRDWIAAVADRPLTDVALVLTLELPGARILRVPAAPGWTTNVFGVAPDFPDQVQLISDRRLTPLLAGADGILIGQMRIGPRTVTIVADPDLIANHGIVRGNNAALVAGLLARVCDGCRLLIDEASHNAVSTAAAPLAFLFTFPFVIVTCLLGVGVALTLWAASGRFGAMVEPKPPLGFGKARLIANAAALLDQAGHHASLCRRYCLVTLRETGQHCHAPPGLSDKQLAAWLAPIERARGVQVPAQTLLAQLDGIPDRNTAALHQAALRITHWKESLLNGSARN